MFKKIRWWRIVLEGILGVVLLVAAAFLFYLVLPFWGIQRWYDPGRLAATPAWALEPWVWEDDVNTREYVEELLAGYKEHDIPASTILIDSPWSTRYNDFAVDEARYPNPEEFFRKLEEQDINVVLWMTCMVDSKSKDTAIVESADWFNEARSKGYLASDAFEISWWKGRGGFIDYTNPEAMTWWHGMQDKLIEWGVDGWKLDGTGTFFSSKIGPLRVPYGKSHAGWMTTRQYMDHYYRDELKYGQTKNEDFITLSRAIDDNAPYIHPNGFAPLDAAPVTWVGDQDHTWAAEDEGLEEALAYILKSAKKGYGVIGSDIGGYGGGIIPPNLYIRWTQFSTFCGLFLNGGHGERRLWERSPKELEIIRKFAWLHSELVPYIYNVLDRQRAGGRPLMRPVGDTYEYYFGHDFFVSPIYQDSLEHTVHLPEGQWRYFFDDLEVIQGPQTITREFPLGEFPVYVREGAIIPMKISRTYTGIGDESWERMLVLNIYPGERSYLRLLRHDSPAVQHCTVVTDMTVSIKLDYNLGARAHVLRVLLEGKPTRVTRGEDELAEGTDWQHDDQKRRLIIKADNAASGLYTIYP